jgi:hypothetical protein
VTQQKWIDAEISTEYDPYKREPDQLTGNAANRNIHRAGKKYQSATHYFLAHPHSLNGSGLEAGVGHDNVFRFNPRKWKALAEVGWPGLTEEQAKAQGIKVKKGLFPWTASGRAISNGRAEGFTELRFDDSPRQGHS